MNTITSRELRDHRIEITWKNGNRPVTRTFLTEGAKDSERWFDAYKYNVHVQRIRTLVDVYIEHEFDETLVVDEHVAA